MPAYYSTYRPVSSDRSAPLRSHVQARHPFHLARIAANPGALINRNPNPVTITLEGSGTNWIQGTTVWTLTGPVGTVLLSSAITGTGAATITISTAGAIGTATISDGTHSVTVQVVGPLSGLAPTRQPAGSRRWFPRLGRRRIR